MLFWLLSDKQSDWPNTIAIPEQDGCQKILVDVNLSNWSEQKKKVMMSQLEKRSIDTSHRGASNTCFISIPVKANAHGEWKPRKYYAACLFGVDFIIDLQSNTSKNSTATALK